MMKAKLEPLNILIVEDEPDLREVIKLILEKIAICHIFEARDGNDGLMKAETQQFDLVITDLKMPNLNGKSLIKHMFRLKPDKKPRKVVVVSAHIDNETKSYITEQKVQYFSKPFKQDLIETYIEESFGGQYLLSTYEKPKNDLNVDFFNPFIDATLKTLKVLADIDAEKGDVFIHNQGEPINSQVAALIPMNCSLFKGSFAIMFEKRCYKHVYQCMTMEEIQEITTDVADGAGELANQIFGLSKTVLNQKGFDLAMTLPSVFIGESINITHLVKGPCLTVQFKTQKGNFYIEAIVKSSRSAE